MTIENVSEKYFQAYISRRIIRGCRDLVTGTVTSTVDVFNLKVIIKYFFQ